MTKVTNGKHEDYSRWVVAALVLSVGILVAFQVYMLREPDRIQTVLAADRAERVTRGQQLFTSNCATCHGQKGEGDIGPALNSKKFLQSTDDGIIFSVIGSGVPGSGMPSWAQANGGPFTDEQINDLVGFIRNWQSTATDVAKPTPTPNPAQGATIFQSTCYACHGPNGEGTDRAPALNDQKLLAQFDDTWFRQTVSQGRPSKGMPTWGKVLSPEQINAVVAYIRQWQTSAPPPAAPTLSPTKAATAAPTATPPSVTSAPKPTAAPTTSSSAPAPTATTEASQPPQPNCGKPDCTKPGPAIAQNLKGDVTAGQKVFVENCEKCHGKQGTAGIDNPGSTDGTVPDLNPIDSAFSTDDPKAFAAQIDAFVEHGSTPDGPSPKNVMDAWGDSGKLTPQQIANVIAYVMSLNTSAPQPTAAPTTSTSAPAPTATTEASQPPQPNCGKPDCTKPGPAIAQNLKGNVTAGQKAFADNCEKCHGKQGAAGIDNPGSTDGTVPDLNPIDPAFRTNDPTAFAAQIDAFIEHGSTPDGPNPKNVMDSWGDSGKLTPQQIADIIAYVMSLNK